MDPMMAMSGPTGGEMPLMTGPSPVEEEESETPPAIESRVQEWLDMLKTAEEKWEPDFKEMREGMKFVKGCQWKDSDSNASEEEQQYVANITLRNVAQKVAALYAHDPKAVAKQRERLDFALWDGKVETLALAFQRVAMMTASGLPADPNDMALLTDYQNGKNLQQFIERVGKTLEVLYQYQIDIQEPEFKKQMKQLVRRTIICGVGYVKLVLENEHTPPMTGDGPLPALSVRLREIQALAKDLEESGASDSDSRLVQLQELMVGMAVQPVPNAVIEQLRFGFPVSTAIIPDPKCRCLKDFIGADWVAERYTRPRAEVESYFEVDLDDCGSVAEYDAKGEKLPNGKGDQEREKETFVMCYEVYHKVSQTRFILCEGYDHYLLEPEPVVPKTKRFWPWFALTFNDIEHEDEAGTSPFPPSDVTLLRPAQKEWNRSREALREHRQYSVPFYVATQKLTDEDKQRLKAAEPGDVIELQGLPPGTDPNTAIAAFQPAKIDPLVYDTEHIKEDILLTVGAQEANLGPTAGATATESTISEQSRVSSVSSNKDDLDDLLSDLARAGSELMIRGMSLQNVSRICGPGAVFPPPEQSEDFVNEVFLVVEAASSGRPNQALEVAKYERVAPQLLAAGANPKFLVEWGAKVADVPVPMDEAFPLVPQSAPAQRSGAQNAPNTMRAGNPNEPRK